MRNTLFGVLLMCIAAVGFTAFIDRTGFSVGRYVPDITLNSIDSTNSQSLRLSGLGGKFTLIDFWATDTASSRLDCKIHELAIANNTQLKSNIYYLRVNLDLDCEMARYMTGTSEAFTTYVVDDPKQLRRVVKFDEEVHSVLIDVHGEVVAINPSLDNLPF